MKKNIQAFITVWLVLIAAVLPQELAAADIQGRYIVLKVKKPIFKEGLEMLGREQNEYARHLSCYAVAEVIKNKGNQKSLDKARKMLGLALHLSPRNREAVIANAQLGKGILPKLKKKPLNNVTLATLLMARAGGLKEAGGEKNTLLAHCFIQLAADLNPLNEDALYEAEMMTQDHGEVDWSKFMKSGK